MDSNHIVVVGASAGGLEPLKTVAAALPADFPAAVFIVMHIAPHGTSALAEILSRHSRLRAVHAHDGERIRAGRIYCARPNCHLLVERETVAVSHGPLENRFRPSIDALFRSAAYNHGPRVIGVVLSGMLHDGTSGLWTIKRLGGVSVVQDPNDSEFQSMPISALTEVDVDHCVSASRIGDLLVRLTREKPRATVPVLEQSERERMEAEIRIASGEFVFRKQRFAHGDISPYACPECHGALAEISSETGLSRFRCHTGHAYSAPSLLSAISDTAESRLMETVRALEEGVMLLEQMARQIGTERGVKAAAPYLAKAAQAQALARRLHDLASQSVSLTSETFDETEPAAEAKADARSA